MLVLGVDTSTQQLGLALCRDEALIGELALGEGLLHAERLIVGLDGILADLGMAVCDLDGLAVSTGPGSFTGLRIGVAAAQGLALALDVPLVGVSTLDVLVESARHWRGPVVGCLDARRGEVYLGAWSMGRAGAERRVEDSVAAPEKVADLLPADFFPSRLPVRGTERGEGQGIDREILVVGDAAPGVAAALEARGARVSVARATERYPRPAHLAAIGARALRDGRKSAPETVVPRYLRRSDAELNRERTASTPGS